jgi:hypothetical protein
MSSVIAGDWRPMADDACAVSSRQLGESNFGSSLVFSTLFYCSWSKMTVIAKFFAPWFEPFCGLQGSA